MDIMTQKIEKTKAINTLIFAIGILLLAESVLYENIPASIMGASYVWIGMSLK